jgi:DNA polymerase/3'-5' exonuclease PolX
MDKNLQIINNLEQLVLHYKKDSKLKFKVNAINKALSYIKKYPYQITSGKYAMEHLPSIGKGIAGRIDEIIETGTLQELPKLANDDTLKALEDLTRITGLGQARARELIKQGITSVDKYREAIQEGKVKTTHHIQVGLKYFDDLEEKIPRTEIVEMEKILSQELKKVDSSAIYNICGSYRRGREFCGDIDVLITTTKNESCLPVYVDKLTEIGFLKDHLTNKGKKKYMGVCQIGNVGRRIDIRYIDYDAYYAALIYFTGSKNFNIKIRNLALEQGYSLSEYGLKDKKTGEIICLHSEREVFDLLGIGYTQPLERDI